MQWNKKSSHRPISVLLTLIIMIGFSACEKVVDIDLNSAEKKYVIEAIVSDKSAQSRVMITQTKDFDQDNTFEGVKDAVVTIQEEGGPAIVFPELSPGVYSLPAYLGKSGKKYSLTVQIRRQRFTATSVMPQRVSMDSLYVTEEFLFGSLRKIANLKFTDPAGRGNGYRFVQYVNDRKVEQIFIQNDEYTDGKPVEAKLYYFVDDDDVTRVKSGDEIRVDLFTIDPAVFKYWFSLFRSSTGQSGQATPANPVSNMEGGALGYFSAQTEETRTVLVP